LSSAQIPLQILALDRGFAEILGKEVLGTLSPTVTAVTDYGDHHLDVCLVVREDLLEAAGQGHEVLRGSYLALN